MTSWHPDSGAAEVLSHGGDRSRPRRSQLLVAAVALLVIGAAAGAGVAIGLRDELPGADTAAVVPALTGGAVETAPDLADRHRYRVALFNPGPGTVRGVSVVGVVGRAVTVRADEPVDLPPQVWRTVYFWLPDECGSPAGDQVHSIRVSTGRGGDAVVEQEIALGGPTDALRIHHRDECVEPTAMSAHDLGGLWTLWRVEGTWTSLAGFSLMRFTSDGGFAFDPEGEMFHEGAQGWFGTYRLHGTHLVLRGSGGYACAKGYSETWTTTLLDRHVLRLDNTRADPGYCHTPPGERWTLHRMVEEADLPSAQRHRVR